MRGGPDRWAWDGALLRRAVGLALVSFAVALVLIIATDQGGAWAVRLGTLAATGPVCGAIGAFGAVALARQRGEQRALLALGMGPFAAARGAVAGGVLFGLVGAGAVPFTDLAGVYPQATAWSWTLQTDGRLHDPIRGVTIDADGALGLTPPVSHAAAPGRSAWTALGLCFLSIPLCLWAASDQSSGRRLLVAGATSAALLVALAWLAAHPTAGGLWLLPGLVPLADLVIGWWMQRRLGRSPWRGG